MIFVRGNSNNPFGYNLEPYLQALAQPKTMIYVALNMPATKGTRSLRIPRLARAHPLWPPSIQQLGSRGVGVIQPSLARQAPYSLLASFSLNSRKSLVDLTRSDDFGTLGMSVLQHNPSGGFARMRRMPVPRVSTYRPFDYRSVLTEITAAARNVDSPSSASSST